jgi:hypothetical protein
MQKLPFYTKMEKADSEESAKTSIGFTSVSQLELS